jgi:predicted naringenin-chalcone synthase
MGYITSVGTAVPRFAIEQERIADFMCALFGLAGDAEARLRKLYRQTEIRRRHSVIADYGMPPGGYEFYPNTVNLEPFPGVGARMQAYRLHAPPLAEQAVYDCLAALQAGGAHVERHEITDIITVSCTGMYAPGIDIDLVHALGLPLSTRRYCINFMGCYAAFNGLKMADALVKADPRAKVLVVCVELCTLHFQKSLLPDHVLSNALFADGAAAALVEAEARPGRTNLEMRRFSADLCPNGKNEMTWEIDAGGFNMTLSKYVADLLQGGLGSLTDALFQNFDVTRDEIAYWAIHPGGPKILDACRRELRLREADLAVSRRVLAEYGNMSSPTVLFVLKELLTSAQRQSGAHVAAMAFGPGLTMESALLRTERTS